MILCLDSQYKLMILALNFTKSLFVVLLRPAETSLMLLLYENGFTKDVLLTTLTNAPQKND